MKFAVIGLGLFGRRLALNLAEMGHEILAIDNNEEHIESVQDHVTHAVIGDATREELINELISQEFDGAIVTVGTSIETSVLVTLHLKEAGIKNIYAKSNSKEHTTILNRLGIRDIVMPEEDVADQLAQKLGNPNIHEFLKLRESFNIVEMSVPEEFLGKSLIDLHLRKEYGVQVVSIRKHSDGLRDTIPRPDYEFSEGDVILVVGEEENIEALTRAFA